MFHELVNRDVTKFASAMVSVVTAVIQMIDAGLLTEETALKLVADVAQRFGQDFDAKAELDAARKENAQRKKDRDADDVFHNLPADLAAARAEQQTDAKGVEKAVIHGKEATA